MQALIALFQPADWLISRLRLANKFWLIEAVFVLPIVLLLLVVTGTWQLDGTGRSVLVGVVVLFVLFGGYLFTGATLSVRRSLGKLIEDAGELAKGDLTSRVHLDVDDELAEVADSFNRMAGQIESLIGSSRQMVEQVTDATDRLASVSEQLAVSAESQSQSAQAMAAAMEEMSVSISHVADHAGHADDVARDAQRQSAEGQTIVIASMHEVEQIAKVIDETTQTVNQLGDSSQQISQIVGVIREIADQTNLLALNAAIEAARAGEVGRGFAVVADEVRKLAERTGTATQQITSMIGQIQTETTRAVTSMHDGNERLQEGVRLAREAGEAMQRIQSGAGDVVQTVSDIASGSAEQKSASNDLARNIEMIAQRAEDNAASVKEARSVARLLQGETKELAGALLRFKVN